MRAMLLAAGLCSMAAVASAETARPDPGPLTIARQGSFFVGGRDVKSDTLSTLPAYTPSGTITVDQMYVHYQVPVGQLAVPIRSGLARPFRRRSLRDQRGAQRQGAGRQIADGVFRGA